MSDIILKKTAVDGAVNEEVVIDDTIFELVGEDEITTLFKLYDKNKDKINPGTIQRDQSSGVTISNTAEYKTHAYLVANSKNYLDGDSYYYSAYEVATILAQNQLLNARVTQLNQQLNSLVLILQSFTQISGTLNKSLADFMQSGDNLERYSAALINFISAYDTFSTKLVEAGFNSFLSDSEKVTFPMIGMLKITEQE